MVALSVLAAFGAMLCWSFGDFFIQRTTRKIGSIESLFWIGLVGTMGLLPWVWTEIPSFFAPANLGILAWLGLLTFVVAIINFEALRVGKLSVIDIILEIELPVTIILSLVFFGEQLSLIHLAMMGAIFFGILLISIKELSLSHLRSSMEKGVQLAFLAALGLGLMNFFTAVGARQVSPIAAIWFPAVIYMVLSLAVLLAQKRGHAILTHACQFPRLILAEGILDTAAWVLYALAVSLGTVSITTAITESYPALAMMLGVALNKEKIVAHQYAGALLAIIASVYLGFWA